MRDAVKAAGRWLLEIVRKYPLRSAAGALIGIVTFCAAAFSDLSPRLDIDSLHLLTPPTTTMSLDNEVAVPRLRAVWLVKDRSSSREPPAAPDPGTVQEHACDHDQLSWMTSRLWPGSRPVARNLQLEARGPSAHACGVTITGKPNNQLAIAPDAPCALDITIWSDGGDEHLRIEHGEQACLVFDRAAPSELPLFDRMATTEIGGSLASDFRLVPFWCEWHRQSQIMLDANRIVLRNMTVTNGRLTTNLELQGVRHAAYSDSGDRGSCFSATRTGVIVRGTAAAVQKFLSK